MRGVLVAVLLLLGVHAAQAGSCKRDDAGVKPLPAGLVGAVQKAFGLQQAPRDWVLKTTVVRCMGGRVWACNMGANLPCGKADTSPALPEGAEWCRENPEADFVPAYITGHDSSWTWRCKAGKPVTVGGPAGVDKEGYLAAYWKMLGAA